MDQPSLPEMKPYVNRNLFSDHFLDELLPEDDSWQVDEDKLKLAMQAVSNLYAGREDEWSSSNEAQLEDKLIRPALQALDHRFEVQPSLPTPDTVSRPDYAFFQTNEQRERAKKEHDGEIEYFDRVIAVGDAKRWDRPLDKKERSGTSSFDRLSPSWQIDYYLRMSGVKWGILTNGRLWRLYNQDTSFRLDINYEIDLPRLLASRDLEAFKYFFLFFRRQAFVRDAEGLCLLDRVYQGSLEFAQAVGDDLKENVYKALRLLAEGFVHTRDNRLDPERDLEEIHANSLVFLYRLLFINYAEDRRLLPRDNALYRDSYGLVSIEREIASKVQRRESIPPLQATYWGKLKTLFDLINQGSAALGIDAADMLVPPYNGGLFDPGKHPFLEEHKVEDRWLAQVIDLLARSQAEGVGGGFVDYSNLDVRHLGSIYEGLLEYKLRVADEEMAAVKRRGKEQWIPVSDVGSSRVLERVEPGSVYLATDRGERKATGSYYTPDYIVKYIVEHTVGPLIQEKMEEDDPIAGILSLKVLDPAMGSGHFLVEATDRLAHALVQALGGAEQEPEEEDIRWARREVVERCIYGVDLNPLAVELAKLSLWLHTVAEGKPLNFLDHHLKVGNSLIGAWIEDLGSLPAGAKKGKAKDADIEARQMNLFETRLHERLPAMLNNVLDIVRRRSDSLDDIRAKAAADQAVEQLKAPFKAVADLWVSTHFGNEVTDTDYQEALEHIGTPTRLLALTPVVAAKQIADARRFFHWELEFPEVLHVVAERDAGPGFDAVVGNPPYVRVQELPHEQIDYFKRTFDTAHRRIDVSVLFFEAALRLLSPRGKGAYISSIQFLTAEYGRRLRKLLLRNNIDYLVDFKDLPVFDDATTYTGIVVFSEAPPSPFDYLGIAELPGRDQVSFSPAVSYEIAPASLSGDQWELIDEGARRLLRRLEDSSSFVALNRLAEPRGGVITGRDEVFNLQEVDVQAHGIERDILLPLMRGPDVDRWSAQASMWLLYPYERAQVGATRLIPETRLSEQFPNAYAYLKARESSLRERRDSRRRVGRSTDWYRIIRHGSYGLFDSAKILTPGETLSNSFAIDQSGAAFSFARVYAIVPNRVDIGFLSAILNSALMQFVLHSLCPLKRGGYYTYSSTYLATAPIKWIEFTTPDAERQQSAATAQMLLKKGDRAKLLSFVDKLLAADPQQADGVHDLLAHLARKMTDVTSGKCAEERGFLDWLAAYTMLPIEEWRLKTVVKGYWEHGWEELQRALRQNRKAIEEASARDIEGREAQEAIQREFEKSMTRLNPLLERIEQTDRLIDLIVYRLYGLTEEEVAIVEGSA